MDAAALKARYDAIHAEATLMAGDLLDIPRRVMILSHLYLDSGRNHAFSQIAAHGALWAYSYFEIGGSLGRLIGRRYYFNADERAFRLGLLNEFAEGFRRVNQLVCIDAYANYYFTKWHGDEPDACEIVPPSLLDALNRVHYARKNQQELAPAEKKRAFEQSFLCEQEVTVAPGVEAAASGFDCRILKYLCLRPLVRFAYFPTWTYLRFRNFSEREERIVKGMRAYDLAEKSGWPQVWTSMREYGRMPESFIKSPEASFAEFQANLSRTVELANRVAAGSSGLSLSDPLIRP